MHILSSAQRLAGRLRILLLLLSLGHGAPQLSHHLQPGVLHPAESSATRAQRVIRPGRVIQRPRPGGQQLLLGSVRGRQVRIYALQREQSHLPRLPVRLQRRLRVSHLAVGSLQLAC